ncbi:hypothetical protein J2Z21_007818 [Streptomyces griseochromogenes]|uniref:Pectate lyase superfamily protein domain-containing protein n=1 Tax=Streptomyces griseochromogenes TaxID=68214 RepID=A0ABS4M580_9ACTN|nr:hypothetical protein [Streptomyces griseochromogenes]MBP2054808.1 hypothetical protein [Streptomyces griseochromogenes]
MASVIANVRDFGAVPGPDGSTTCSDAFQRAVDSLDENIGGIVFVPADSQPYELRRSVMVDRNKVRVVGEGSTASTLHSAGATPALTFGLRRITHGRPLSDGHWADLRGMLDASVTDRRWGCRSRVPSPVEGEPTSEATVTFPCSPFQFGPPDGNYWSDVRRLTLDFVVRNDAMPWSAQPLFGMADAFYRPSPFCAYVEANSGVVVFRFRTADGLQRDVRIPFDPAQPVLRCSLQLDLDARTVAAWTNRQQATQRIQVRPDLALVNDGWAPGESGGELAFVPNWYAPFRIAAVGPESSGWGGGGELPGGPKQPVDLTFGALRFSDTLRYRDLGEGQEQQDAHGKVDDLRCLTVEPHVFGALTMREEVHKSAAGVPDLQILWEGIGTFGHGFFVPHDLVEYVEGNGCEKLNVRGFSFAPRPANYGQVIGLGLLYNMSLNDLKVEFGAQGLSTHHFGANYPVSLRSCRFEHQSDCAVYSYFQNTTADYMGLGYYGRSAFKALRSRVDLRNVYCTDSKVCESAVRLFQTQAVLDNWQIDFEGFTEDLPRDSYIWASIADDIGGPTQLCLRDCVGSAGGEHTVAIRLVSNERGAGLPDISRQAGWCTIERSFNHFSDPRMPALVAVDGPLWQGLYEGIPPTDKPLVINTATPGASARIGIGTVPPPATVPFVPPAGDPLLGLPGLIGYYRADALGLRDGAPVTSLTDLSPAGHHGTPVGSPAVLDSSAAGGLAALRFAGGRYEFAGTAGTTGAATWFFVAKRLPFFESAPGRRGSLRTYGQGFLIDPHLLTYCAESDTDWAVYAVRCTAGPARRLQTYVNSYPYDLRRDDRASTVAWATPVLSHRDDVKFRGLLAAAVICDAALDDEQVTDTCRYLLHRYRIPV